MSGLLRSKLDMVMARIRYAKIETTKRCALALELEMDPTGPAELLNVR